MPALNVSEDIIEIKPKVHHHIRTYKRNTKIEGLSTRWPLRTLSLVKECEQKKEKQCYSSKFPSFLVYSISGE